MKKILKHTLILIVFCVISIIGFQTWTYFRFEQAFSKLSPGMSKQQVFELFASQGKEQKVVYTTPTWDQTKVSNSPPVAEERVYWSPLLTPEGWLVGFDKNGHLVARARLVSP
jgi:hypothetical protein